MAVVVTGQREIDRKLASLKTRKAKSITRTGVTKMMRVIVRGIKAEVPGNVKDLKRTIGYSVKTESNEIVGKAGPSVGKSRGKVRTRTKKRGVGISRQNAHWFVLGTKNMPSQAPGMVPRGTQAKLSEGKAVMIASIKEGIAKAVR